MVFSYKHAYAAILTLGVIVLHAQLPHTVLDRLSINSLNRYHNQIYTQSGEDGVIQEIFNRLGIFNGFCVEFGAVDGKIISNTRHLWEQGWHCAMIETDQKFFAQLVKNYFGDQKVLCINEFVIYPNSIHQGKTFDQIAAQYFPGQEIDFLVIDIDGADYLILETLQSKPKVICIEAGLHWHPLLDIRIPDIYACDNRQQPLPVMIAIARERGYQPICFEGGNLFLVRNDLYHFFEDVPQDAFTLWRDGWRSAPKSHDHLLWVRATDPVIRAYEGDLVIKMPITKDF